MSHDIRHEKTDSHARKVQVEEKAEANPYYDDPEVWLNEQDREDDERRAIDETIDRHLAVQVASIIDPDLYARLMAVTS